MSLSTKISKMVIVSAGEEKYGLNIQHVASIERVLEITPMPELPDDVLGVIHLRGKIIPVVDFGRLIGNGKSLMADGSRIVVLQKEDELLGLLTESATDVIDVPSDTIQSAGSFNKNEESLIHGVAKHQDQLIIIMNCPVIFDRRGDV
jgi:purine-binding chemotaxis protein CheW